MIKNFLACTAAAVLAFAPIAVQAGTRAADASVSLARLGSPIGVSEQLISEEDEWLLVLLFGAAAAAIIIAIENSEDDGSPATGG